MKVSVRGVVLVVVIVVFGVLLFTSIGGRARRYFGVFISEITVASKENEQLPLETYDWQLKNFEGRKMQFEKYKGRVIFLNFWATWCKPCIKELPDIQELYKDYGKDVVFILLTQEESSKVNTFIKKTGLNLPVYYPSTPVPDVLFSKTVPATYIINKTGQIILAETGAADWNNQKTRLILEGLISE